MPSITLATQTVATQTGTAVPTIPTTVLTNSLTALDTSASRGPASNADNTALPLFGCRAFVNFNGNSYQNVTVNGATEAHCVIRSSGNVRKVVRSGVGIYVIHFSTAMPDSNYSYALSGSQVSAHPSNVGPTDGGFGTTSFTISTHNVDSTPAHRDYDLVSVCIFR